MKNRKGIPKSRCVDPLGLTYELRWKLTVHMKRSPPLVMQGMGAMLMEGSYGSDTGSSGKKAGSATKRVYQTTNAL